MEEPKDIIETEGEPEITVEIIETKPEIVDENAWKKFTEWKFDQTNTFCISLKTSIDRRERIQKRFEYFQLDVSMCDAATAEDLTDNFVDYLSPGQRGCAQSHMNLWRHMVNNKLPYAFIMEDDAMFHENWREKLDMMLELIKTNNWNWDAVFLNSSEPVVPVEIWSLALEQYLTGGYIISYDGATRLVNMYADTLYAADWMTTRLQTYNKCYTFFPWLIIQEGLDTTIGSGVEADHAKVVRLLNQYNYNLQGTYGSY